MSPFGQSNWLIFFIHNSSHAPIGLFHHSAPSSCPSCVLVGVLIRERISGACFRSKLPRVYRPLIKRFSVCCLRTAPQCFEPILKPSKYSRLTLQRSQAILKIQIQKIHPASRAFLSLARFVLSRERLSMNRVRSLLLGCRIAIPVRKLVRFLRFLFFIFFRVGKSLACHSPAKWCLCAYSPAARIFLGSRG